MTEQEIDAMEAGRELDALVAEKIMGWKVVDGWWDMGDGRSWPVEDWCDDYERVIQEAFRPSTDMSAAWYAIERVEATGKWASSVNAVRDQSPNKWCTEFWPTDNWSPRVISSYAETAPLAICRAVLKVASNDLL